MNEVIKELFVVDKKLGIRKAKRMANQVAINRGIERNTPWHTSIITDSIENSDPKFYGDLWSSVVAHFNTGRDRLYYLFVIVTQ